MDGVGPPPALPPLPRRPAPASACSIAAVGWAVSSYGFYHGYQSLWHGGAVLVVVGCILTVLGKQALFRFFPAVAVLVFIVPVPGLIRQQIAIPLQTWTAQITAGDLEVCRRAGRAVGQPLTRQRHAA